MIDPKAFLHLIINPGTRLLSQVTGEYMHSPEARVELLAIAPQESGLDERRQLDSQGDPLDDLARGWWQFEEGGGVVGVMNHPASAHHARTVCALMFVTWDAQDIHEAIAWNGYIALAFARLLLWTDTAPLPPIGDQQGAWDYYLRCWRPGKPHPETWPEHYQTAVRLVTEVDEQLSEGT